VDVNSDLLVNNTQLTDVSSLFKDVLFSEWDYYEANEGENPQISWSIFAGCSELQNVSRLFEVSNARDYDRGLRIIQSILFDPQGNDNPYNPRIVNISGMFNNNR